MKHINDKELMEYAAGRLASPEKEQVAEHIAGCQECSQRRSQAQMLWDALGQWTVDTSGHEIADKIAALAEKAPAPAAENKTADVVPIVRRPLVHRPSLFSAVLRIAASILIAVGVGYKLGKSSVTGKIDTTASNNRPAYLSAFGLGWSSELTWLILEDGSPNAEPAPEGQGR